MKTYFRIISFLEGTSFLLILFITMPLKYLFQLPLGNKYVGMLHGILFLGYVVLAFFMKNQEKWRINTLTIVLLCSIVPFGTFWMDQKYLKKTA